MGRCLLALCFGVWRCLLDLLALLGLPSDDIADSSDSVSWGSIHCPVPVRVSDSVLAVLFNITHCLQGILTLLGLCPTLPIFLKLPKLSPSLSRWDTTDNHGLQDRDRTPDNEQSYLFPKYFGGKFGGVSVPRVSSDVFVVTGSEMGHLSRLEIERMQKKIFR